MNKPAIGGYFELALNEGDEYHPHAIRLNTGRNAFEYILRARKYKRVFLPYYTCDAMLEPIQKLGLEYRFYHINANFEPCFDYAALQEDESFVYTNYFGLKDQVVSILAKTCRNLIVDNAQAFYSKLAAGVDIFYSPRKFFGLPDGAYLYTDAFLDDSFERDISTSRFEHLLMRIEYGPEAGYQQFVENNRLLRALAIKRMSNLTRRLLQNIDYAHVAAQRRSNFLALHNELEPHNKLELTLTDTSVPLVYPFYSELKSRRKDLIENRIYVAQYWPNVKEWTKKGDIERRYAENIIPLPVDQRYSNSDMKYVATVIRGRLQ